MVTMVGALCRTERASTWVTTELSYWKLDLEALRGASSVPLLDNCNEKKSKCVPQSPFPRQQVSLNRHEPAETSKQTRKER